VVGEQVELYETMTGEHQITSAPARPDTPAANEGEVLQFLRRPSRQR
jgi:hypothetical protein